MRADNRRSRYGFAIFLDGCLVSWRSKLHATVSLSTAESEYIAACEAAKEIQWLRSLLLFLGCAQTAPTVLHEDNQAAINMIENPVVSGRNKHVQLRCHYVRQLHRDRVIVLRYIGTADQVADSLTKILPRPAHEAQRRSLLDGPTG